MITMPDDLLQAAVDRANKRIRALLRPYRGLSALPPEARAEYDRLVEDYLDAIRRRDAARARETSPEPEPAAA